MQSHRRDSVGGSYEPETAAGDHRCGSGGGMLHGKSMGTAYSRASVCVRTFVRASVALRGQRSDRSSGTRQGLAAVGTATAPLGHADLSCRTYT
jgi:hypothetical protein